MRHRWLVAACAIFVFVSWVVLPALNYRLGTSENITVEVVAEPFLESGSLVYRWSGDVVRSCSIELRRSIVDSESVITNLTSRDRGRLPSSALGHASYEARVPVPFRIAEGPAQYLVTEVPSCNWMQRLFPIAIDYPPVDFTVTR
jgi:hypothetical protein